MIKIIVLQLTLATIKTLNDVLYMYMYKVVLIKFMVSKLGRN